MFTSVADASLAFRRSLQPFGAWRRLEHCSLTHESRLAHGGAWAHSRAPSPSPRVILAPGPFRSSMLCPRVVEPAPGAADAILEFRDVGVSR